MDYLPWILIGLALLIIILAIIAYYFGFTNVHHHQLPIVGSKHVACVGDSITYGFALVNQPKNNYPKMLGELLGKSWHVENFGVSSRTAVSFGDKPYKRELEYRRSLEFHPEVVVIMFGSNDSKPYNWQGKESFMDEIEQLVINYQLLTTKPEVILCTPARPYYILGKRVGNMLGDIRAEEVAEAAEVIRALGIELNLKVVDVHKLTEEHPEWFKFDGIHPNNHGAKAIALAVYHAITDEA